jgi:hypothetical protein
VREKHRGEETEYAMAQNDGSKLKAGKIYLEARVKSDIDLEVGEPEVFEPLSLPILKYLTPTGDATGSRTPAIYTRPNI